MSVERTIVCDDCGRIIAARRLLADARADALSTGALSSPAGDLCHWCRIAEQAGGAQ